MGSTRTAVVTRAKPRRDVHRPKGDIRNEFGLTPTEERFARARADGKNKSRAYAFAIEPVAGSERTKPVTINTQGCLFDKRPQIVRRIAQLEAELKERFTVDAVALLRESARIAFSSPVKLMKRKGNGYAVKMPHELDEDTAAAVASFEVDEKGRVKYKFWDKNNAHERLFRHAGLFEKDNEQNRPAFVTKIELVALQPLEDAVVIENEADDEGD